MKIDGKSMENARRLSGETIHGAAAHGLPRHHGGLATRLPVAKAIILCASPSVSIVDRACLYIYTYIM